MESKVFLAMTEREMEEFLPEKLAYMACRFSPYSSGLTNLPSELPPNSMLLLDDSMPIKGHDPKVTATQLQELVHRFSPSAVLLDFQNPVTPEGKEMVSAILQALPCPVAVTEQYATFFDCPVFLSPPPVNVPLQKHLTPWLNRGIFLEVTGDRQQFTVTERGCNVVPLPAGTVYETPQIDRKLHCHYHVDIYSDKAVFTLQRTKNDLLTMAEEALQLGVRGAVGLYQELK